MIERTTDGAAFNVRVIPRARRSGLAGTRGDALLVRLQAPPVEGAANDELIEVLAGALQVSEARRVDRGWRSLAAEACQGSWESTPTLPLRA